MSQDGPLNFTYAFINWKGSIWASLLPGFINWDKKKKITQASTNITQRSFHALERYFSPESNAQLPRQLKAINPVDILVRTIIENNNKINIINIAEEIFFNNNIENRDIRRIKDNS